jgi:hypothetical protein
VADTAGDANSAQGCDRRLERRAIIALDIAINHPERMTKLFAFAANSDPSGVADIAQSPVFNAYIARAGKEHQALSPARGQYKS